MVYVSLFFSFLFPLAVFWMPARFKGQSTLSFILRRTLIVLPYMFWLVVLDVNQIQWRAVDSIILFGTVAILLLWEKDDFLFKASQTYAGLVGPLEKPKFIVNMFNLLVFVVAEEAFFRLGILTVFETRWAVGLQALAFVAGHYLTPWGKSFRAKDLLRQGVFAVVAGIYFLETKDFLSCALAHLVLNSAELIHLVRRVQIKTPEEEVFCGTL